MILEPKTLKLIDEIADEMDDRLPARAAKRLEHLRNIVIAGATLTTVERNEVSDLWGKYVR